MAGTLLSLAEQPRAPLALAVGFLGSSRIAFLSSVPSHQLLISILLFSRSQYLHPCPTGACCFVPTVLPWSQIRGWVRGDCKAGTQRATAGVHLNSAITDVFSVPGATWPVPKLWELSSRTFSSSPGTHRSAGRGLFVPYEAALYLARALG